MSIWWLNTVVIVFLFFILQETKLFLLMLYLMKLCRHLQEIPGKHTPGRLPQMVWETNLGVPMAGEEAYPLHPVFQIQNWSLQLVTTHLVQL